MTAQDILTAIVEVEGDIHVMEKELIPDLKKTLAYLTSPDYDPDLDPDHEFRKQDIEDCDYELLSHRKDLRTSREKLQKLYRKLAQMMLGSGIAD